MMSDDNPILFFSDAHLGAHDPAQERLKIERFTSLLHHAREIGAEIFFLGDLFDFWFEYRHWIPKVPTEVLASIQAFTRDGGRFHLALGNHDTWAGDYFSHDLGVEIHRHDFSITRHGMRVFISHGDGKAKSDGGYRALKRVLRFGPNIWLFRLLPADWAFRLARFFSGRSRELTAGRPPKFLPEYDQVALDLLRGDYDAVIMGHLHQGWVRKLDDGWWVNTGEFFERFTYVRLDGSGFVLSEWHPGKDAGFPPSRE
jgi:UDP-2,3-diacylglucosamine hydrolase